jgi:hypothetical protein
MPVVSVAAERSMEAPGEEVYRRIADFRVYADELKRLDRYAIAGSG